MKFWDLFWHRLLKRPYILARVVEEGKGTPVILLHGLGGTSAVWSNVRKLLSPLQLKVIAFDLLGFGASPKPGRIKYDVDDHARAVIASLNKMRLGQPAIIVGHSMGCLVAVRVARLRPDLAKHIVLFEMPLYEGLPEKRIYRVRTDFYFKVYRKIMTYHPNLETANARVIEWVLKKIAGLDINEHTWLPFVRSLENTIMKQTAADDLKNLKVPMDVIYGSFDMLVIRGEPQLFFGGTSGEKIKAHTIRALHEISHRSSRFIVSRIQAAEHGADTVKALKREKEMLRGK